jgi:hypothetical protein
VRGQLHTHLDPPGRDGFERLAPRHQQDGRPRGHDARSPGRPGEEGHLAEEGTVRQARQRHRRLAVLGPATRYLELAAGHDVRLGSLGALLHDDVPRRDRHHVERSEQLAQGVLRQRAEER